MRHRAADHFGRQIGPQVGAELGGLAGDAVGQARARQALRPFRVGG